MKTEQLQKMDIVTGSAAQMVGVCVCVLKPSTGGGGVVSPTPTMCATAPPPLHKYYHLHQALLIIKLAHQPGPSNNH